MSVGTYSNFVFSPADLAEDVDLDVEQRKQILFLHANLAAWTHWQVLGIPWNANADQVREAYRDRVKVFHPDRYPGRRLGSYQGRLEQIFRRLTEARDLLTVEGQRAAYAQQTASPEDFARLETRKLESEERAKERRARLARTNPLVHRVAQVADLVKRGRAHLESGRFVQAVNDFMTAVSLDPRATEAKELAAEARKRAAGERAKEAYERGLAAETVNNAPVSLAFFLEAVAADPSNPRYPIAAARVSLAVGDKQSARQLAETAVRIAPRHAAAHEALGAALAAEGLAKEARKALERALELDPNLESARAQLKKLRWSFLG
ncbi:MAG TPA: tetratricopeptide repeat protein [Anaeromyxobacteraceae bacterium]|nr:tetratricopeptide repeat protein [Anaeromyxobacteraceae bacterium]